MSGPAPTHQPTFTAKEIERCRDVIRRHSAPQDQVYRARLALLLHDDPTLDSVRAGELTAMHPNSVRNWRRAWATEGFRLNDLPGRGRKPRIPPLGRDNGRRPGV